MYTEKVKRSPKRRRSLRALKDGITDSCVDEKLRYISFMHILHMGATFRGDHHFCLSQNVVDQEPQNASSICVIPVPKIVRPAAIALRKTDKKYIWEAGRKGNPSYFLDKFKESLATIDWMPILTPHCCRVTYVSIMQSLGVKLETISHLVGHTTTRITESRYLRVQDETCQDALDRYDQRFGLFGNP